MIQARGRRSATLRLPFGHGRPLILPVADIGSCMEVYADFTRTGRAYAQFRDSASFRIMLEDLRDEKVRERLRAVREEPMTLDPTSRAATATRVIATLLANLARRLGARKRSPDQVSGFLMRLLFTMFAPGTKLIPEDSFIKLHTRMLPHPKHLHLQLTALWQAMDTGGFASALEGTVLRFNG